MASVKSTTKPTSLEIATKISDLAKEYNAQLDIGTSIFSVHMRFLPGEAAAFGEAECKASIILDYMPRSSPGSTWGTDGIAAMCAIKSGRFTMNKSGCNKNVLKALAKIW